MTLHDMEDVKKSLIALVSDEERNPLNTTTYGVGEVIRDAIDKGCRHWNTG